MGLFFPTHTHIQNKNIYILKNRNPKKYIEKTKREKKKTKNKKYFQKLQKKKQKNIIKKRETKKFEKN